MSGPTVDGYVTVAGLLAIKRELEDALRPLAGLLLAFSGRPDSARAVSTAVGDISVADIRRAAALLERLTKRTTQCQ